MDYWNEQPATIDGVLGGYDYVHKKDCETSETMIRDFMHIMPAMSSVLDCGAGIGRVSRDVLKPFFKHVDLCEPSLHYLNEARNYYPEARNYYNKKLQEFEYETQYDAIWI